MYEDEWCFDTQPAWHLTVAGRPQGDSTVFGCQQAVPQIVAAGIPPAPTPAVVVARVSSFAPSGPKGRAKALLDALHDGRLSGPWYRDFGAPAPLPGDEPRYVRGLAVEMRRAEEAESVEYMIGSNLRV